MTATGQRAHEIVAAALPTKIPAEGGDSPRLAVNAETTDRLIIFDTNGRFCHAPAANPYCRPCSVAKRRMR